MSEQQYTDRAQRADDLEREIGRLRDAVTAVRKMPSDTFEEKMSRAVALMRAMEGMYDQG